MLYALCSMRYLIWIGPTFLWTIAVNSVPLTPEPSRKIPVVLFRSHVNHRLLKRPPLAEWGEC